MKAITGNIHLMQIMAVLNCFPELTKYGYNIGQIQVLNPANLQGIVAGSNEELIYNYNQLAKITSEKVDYKNQLENIKFARKIDLLRNQLKQVLSLGDDKFSIFNSTLTDLDKAISLSDEELIIKQLTQIQKELENKYGKRIQTT